MIALRPLHRQHGLVLASSLLLLVVVTIMALSMFRNYGVQERMAGNIREKHRALQSAQAAQQWAEDWLSTNAKPTSDVTCTGGTTVANGLQPLPICDSTSDLVTLTGNPVTAAPWKSGLQDVGAIFTPSGANAIMNVGSGLYFYYQAPRLYITHLGKGTLGEVYQVDAAGFGGTADSVAVVESTFYVYNKVIDGGLP